MWLQTLGREDYLVLSGQAKVDYKGRCQKDQCLSEDEAVAAKEE